MDYGKIGKRLTENTRRDFRRMGIVALVFFICCVAAWVMNKSDAIGKVYTHLFYIPVILAGTWFRKKAYILSIVLGTVHILIEYADAGEITYAPFVRVAVLFLVTFVVVLLANRNAALQNKITNRLHNMQQMNEAIGDIMGRCDSAGKIRYITPSVWKILGYRQEDMLGHHFIDFIYMDDKKTVRKEIEDAIRIGKEFRRECRAITKRGQVIWLEILMNPILMDKSCTGAVFTGYDITERRQNEDEIREKIYLDELTQIYNRRFIDMLIEKHIQEAAGGRHLFSILMLDIDRFKRVNDSYGHPVGDKVLVKVAQLIQHSIRYNDYLARFGGEEFIVLLPRTDVCGAWEIAERIRQYISNYKFDVVGRITISIGVADYIADDGKDELIQKADEALYLAKNRGRNRVAVYSHFGFRITEHEEIKWNPVWECGEKTLDEQHQNLLDLLNQLISTDQEAGTVSNRKEALFQIKKELMEHFTFEEYVLEQQGYTDMEAHRALHNEIVQTLEKALHVMERNEETDNLVIYQFLMDMIVGHMIEEDRTFFAHLDEER